MGALSLLAILLWRPGVRALSHEVQFPFDNLKRWFNREILTRAQAVFHRAEYASRIHHLERNLATLRLEISSSRELEEENARLRKLLDFPPPPRTHWQAAPVLSHGGAAGVWQSIRVGKGSLHGVKRGDPVVLPDCVVGRVAEVSAHTCDVMLLTDPNSRIAAELELHGEDVGTARGILYGGGTRSGTDDLSLKLLYVVEPLRLRYLEMEFVPPPRTRVVTSGLGHVFPKGLTLGWLLDSQIDSTGLSREGEVVPAVDFASLTEVFLLQSSESGKGTAPTRPKEAP
ncbi:MAG: rod shape-determining protein MreC [Kiritimatiellae bacterium]|nr:rod shape-determining protein MreC [Kiritimatiellia bacterium]